MNKNNYVIEGIPGFSDTIFYKAMKSKYTLFEVFKRENPKFPLTLLSTMSEFWDEIQELSIEEMFGEENTEKRRILFHCYGPERLFKSFESRILDKQTITKNNIKVVDGKNQHYSFEDTYTLYEITDKRFLDMVNEGVQWESQKLSVFMVHCKCTTTGRDYYIYVPDHIGKEKDAVTAIAWTFQVPTPIDNIEEMYRHGDVLMLKVKNSKRLCESWARPHLKKSDYLNLLKIEA